MINCRLKELLAAKRIRQKDLAEEINVTEPTLSNWVRGITVPDVITAIKIANRLEITVEEIWSISE